MFDKSGGGVGRGRGCPYKGGGIGGLKIAQSWLGRGEEMKMKSTAPGLEQVADFCQPWGRSVNEYSYLIAWVNPFLI